PLGQASDVVDVGAVDSRGYARFRSRRHGRVAPRCDRRTRRRSRARRRAAYARGVTPPALDDIARLAERATALGARVETLATVEGLPIHAFGFGTGTPVLFVNG